MEQTRVSQAFEKAFREKDEATLRDLLTLFPVMMFFKHALSLSTPCSTSKSPVDSSPTTSSSTATPASPSRSCTMHHQSSVDMVRYLLEQTHTPLDKKDLHEMMLQSCKAQASDVLELLLQDSRARIGGPSQYDLLKSILEADCQGCFKIYVSRCLQQPNLPPSASPHTLEWTSATITAVASSSATSVMDYILWDEMFAKGVYEQRHFMLIYALNHHRPTMLEFLLNHPVGQEIFDTRSVNDALQRSITLGDLPALTTLLNHPTCQFLPQHYQAALELACEIGATPIIAHLIQKPPSNIHVDLSYHNHAALSKCLQKYTQNKEALEFILSQYLLTNRPEIICAQLASYPSVLDDLLKERADIFKDKCLEIMGTLYVHQHATQMPHLHDYLQAKRHELIELPPIHRPSKPCPRAP